MGAIARGLTFAVFGVTLLGGCLGEEQTRARAAAAMNCPVDDVYVEPGFGPTRKVYGCGRTVDMVCSNTLRGGKSGFNGIAPSKTGGVASANGCVAQDGGP